MKKTLIALAALAAGTAFAQSTVTISGGVNIGYGRTTTDGADAAVMTNAGPRSHITFSGAEDLGGGLKATFGIQNRFNPTTGANSYAVPFEQVWAGLSGNFGEIKMGRFTGVWAGPQNAFDPWGTDTTGVSHSGTARYNGQVAYITPKFSGFQLGVQVNPKANQTNAVQNGVDVGLSYANGPLFAFVGAREDTNKDNLLTLSAVYDFGMVKPSFGYTKTSPDANNNDKTEWTIGATAPVTANVLVKAGYRSVKVKNGADSTRFAVGAEYLLSKRTSVVFDLNHDDDNTAAKFQTGYYAGLRHTF